VTSLGFLAVSYLQDSVCVVDLRGPDIILREGFGDDSSASERRGSVGAVASTLKFAICGLGSGTSPPHALDQSSYLTDTKQTGTSDPNPQIRLLASYESGLTRITTLSDGLAGWTADKKPATVTHDSQARPIASFIIDAGKGFEQVVSLQRLKSASSS